MTSAFWDREVETLPLENQWPMQVDLLRDQLERLRKHSAFYARRLPADVRRISEPSDYSRVPLMTKVDLRDARADGSKLPLFELVEGTRPSRYFASSGTTGRTSLIGLTTRDIRSWNDVAARVLFSVGLRSDDVVINCLALGLFSGGVPILEGIGTVGAAQVPVGPADPNVTLQWMNDLQATFLICSTSYARYLAETAFSGESALRVPESLKTLMIGTEPGVHAPHLMDLLERVYSSSVVDGLGSSEVMPLFAGMCLERAGKHLLAPDHLYLELIDPASGQGVDWRSGAAGELVVTHLQRESSPLVRYRTGDWLRVDGMDCPCGRTGPRVTCLGRVSDVITLQDREIFPTDVLDLVAAHHPDAAGPFEIVVRGAKATDSTVEIVIEYGRSLSDLTALRAALEEDMLGRFGQILPLRFAPPQTLPRFDRKSQLLRFAV